MNIHLTILVDVFPTLFINRDVVGTTEQFNLARNLSLAGCHVRLSNVLKAMSPYVHFGQGRFTYSIGRKQRRLGYQRATGRFGRR
jgi:hypothetical protein